MFARLIRALRSRLAASPALRAALAGAVLASGLAGAQSFKLPDGYMGRFGSSELSLSNETGFGVRYLPLPLTPDIRVSLVKQGKYWEYNVGTRLRDTTVAAGIFFNGYGAAAGIPRLEITHNPAVGPQASLLLQGGGPHSHLSFGSAYALADGRVRVLGTVGIAFQGEVTAPYAQLEVGSGYGKAFGPVSTYVAGAARVYGFPVQQQYQASADLYGSVSYAPLPGLSLSASHFERFVTGKVPIPDFGFGRVQASELSATYRLGARDLPVTLGAVRARVSRDWRGDATAVRGDLLVDVRALPVMLGPSVGYQFTPNGGQWLISLVSLGR